MFKSILLILSLGFSFSARADDNFICSCVAKGPGYEEGVNIDKICSYTCDCSGTIVDVDKVKTTAKSLETWDIGNHICHGQYAYRATLSSPNWQIQVKFSPFMINSNGELTYDEMTEIASGIRSTMKRTQTAPEILSFLKQSLQK